MAGTLAPSLKFYGTDASGNPLSGGLLYSYAAGTSTPQSTYTDATMTVANSNPVVLDSAGRANVFLDPTATYKFILRDSTNATIYTQDLVLPQGYGAGTCSQGRLTLTSGSAVSPDVTSGTTLYFTPYQGNRISLYTGAAWSTLAFSETSITLVGLAVSKNYDVFGYLNSSGALQLELLVWTSDTARATALTLQDGIWSKTGDTTRRYLGTVRTTAAGGAVTDSVLVRGVWNATNRVKRTLRVQDLTDNWNYTTAAYRQANGSGANQVSLLSGLGEDTVSLRSVAIAFNTNAGVNLATAIGFDSTTTAATGMMGMLQQTQVVGTAIQFSSTLEHLPSAGYHTYVWLEFSAATGTTTWVGDGGAGSIQQSGLDGSTWG